MEVTNFVVRPDDMAALVKKWPILFVGNFMLPAEVYQEQQNTTLKQAQMPASPGAYISPDT